MPYDDRNLEQCVASLKEESKENQSAHREIYAKIEKISQENAVANERYQQILTSMNELKADVKELKERPGKKWDFLMSIVLQWAVLGILAATVILK